MSKYFKEGETKKLKLSEYLKMGKSKFKYYVCDEKYIGARTKYIMDVIGDVKLDEETYTLFMQQFNSCGGRYDVRTKRETIKGIYDISQKYPFLTSKSLEVIWFVYIYDQFEACDLEEQLGKYFELYGKTEEALDKYLDYVDEIAKEYDKQFYESAAMISKIFKGYDYDFIEYLELLIKRQHISLEKIISSVPTKELIEKDKEQLRKLIEETRIYFGACYPISYQMVESLVTEQGLDFYPEQPKYLICGTKTVDATFTKQEFLESIKERTDKKEKSKVLKI